MNNRNITFDRDRIFISCFMPMGRGRLEDIETYIINDKSVILFFRDGSKTVATVDERDTFDIETGFCLAMFKHFFKINHISKASYKRELECIKEDKFKDYLVEIFNRFTFKNLEKTRRFLRTLKPTGKKRVKLK